MNQINDIKKQLRTLKLSGIVELLEIRLMEAENNSLAYSDFLSLILDDEMEKRQQRKLRRLLGKAGIKKEQTLENFDFSFNPSIKAAYIKELAGCRFIHKGENVFFMGPTGTGKTHLTQAICHQACRMNLKVAYFKFYELFNFLKQAEMKNNFNQIFNRLIKTDLIAIDDFAFKKIEPKDAEYLYALVDSRYHFNSMIITSNRDFNDWMGAFSDPIIANAILDRLAHNAHQIIIKGESYRKRFKPVFENT